jgi:hypothetical protein
MQRRGCGRPANQSQSSGKAPPRPSSPPPNSPRPIRHGPALHRRLLHRRDQIHRRLRGWLARSTKCPYFCRAASPDVQRMAPISAHEAPACRAAVTASSNLRSIATFFFATPRSLRKACGSTSLASAGSAFSKNPANSSALLHISFTLLGTLTLKKLLASVHGMHDSNFARFDH